MSFERTILLSVCFHLFVFAIFSISFNKKYPVPSVYEVRLVMPGAGFPKMPEAPTEKKQASKTTEQSAPPAENKKSAIPAVKPEKKDDIRDRETDYNAKEELLRTMQAKEKLKERAKLKEVISIGKDAIKAEATRPAQNASQPGSGRGDPALSFYAYDLREWVHKHYFFPDTRTQGIEAIISVIILADGTIVFKKYEKKSGNPLFDDACRRAIQQSSPYKPPPREFELDLRFYP